MIGRIHLTRVLDIGNRKFMFRQTEKDAMKTVLRETSGNLCNTFNMDETTPPKKDFCNISILHVDSARCGLFIVNRILNGHNSNL